jgi:hypothetical protein
MKYCAIILMLLASSLAWAQTPHITQPFFYLWDYTTANINGSSGIQQVAHFEIVLDGNPTTLAPPILSIPSTVAGDTTFKLAADINLPLGNHAFSIVACPTLVSSTVAGSGCSAGATPFAFVLDPRPLPSARRLGVGV